MPQAARLNQIRQQRACVCACLFHCVHTCIYVPAISDMPLRSLIGRRRGPARGHQLNVGDVLREVRLFNSRIHALKLDFRFAAKEQLAIHQLPVRSGIRSAFIFHPIVNVGLQSTDPRREPARRHWFRLRGNLRTCRRLKHPHPNGHNPCRPSNARWQHTVW